MVSKKDKETSKKPSDLECEDRFSEALKEEAMTEGFRSSKKMVAALLISVSLNVGLLASLIIVAVLGRGSGEVYTPSEVPVSSKTLSPLVQREVVDLLKKPLRELIELLHDKTEIDKNIYRRDVALSCLVCFHNFHLEKALGGIPFEVRNYSFTDPQHGEQISLTFFPEITEEAFIQLVRFTQTEKWPLTPKGIFLELKSSGNARSLKEAFCRTPEFVKLVKICQRGGLLLTQEELSVLLLQGSWEYIERIVRYADKSEPRSIVRTLLLHLVAERSSDAARRLIEMDAAYVLESYRNEQLSALVDVVEGSSTETVSFLSALSEGIRPKYLKDKAEKKLFLLAQQRAHSSSYAGALHGADAGAKDGAATAVTPKAKEIEYTVKSGDSLWKIAQQYQVNVRKLKERNNLDTSSMIRPGQKIIIPNDN